MPRVLGPVTLLSLVAACHAPATPQAAAAPGETIGPWSSEAPFERLILSWNIDVPQHGYFVVEAQVRRSGGAPSPWLHLGDWGDVPRAARGAVAFPGGAVEVDTLLAQVGQPFDAWRWRVRAAPGAEPRAVVALCDTPADFRPPGFVTGTTPARAIARHVVPALSQRSEAAEIAGRICSPTCVAMVLAAFDREQPTAQVAAALYDPFHDLYGVWPRAVQYAWTQGVPGRLEALRTWEAVEERLDAGSLLVLSIGYEDGALRGAPLERTAGHLVLLTGFEPDGRALVHDPAAPDVPGPAGVLRRYLREDLEEVWMRRGGLAYVFDPPEPG